MKTRRMISLVLALMCLMSVLALNAFAAEILEVPTADEYFGCIINQYRKDGKTSLEYYMPCHDKGAIEDYINLLECSYGLTLKKSHQIQGYGDYYYSLNYGNVNCLMMYWDKSYELMTVTVYDSVACFVSAPSTCGTICVESPASFFNKQAEVTRDDNCYTYEMSLGRNGIYALAEYLVELKAEYGLEIDDSRTVEEDGCGIYYLVNGNGDTCLAIVTADTGSDYLAGFVFDGDYCIPVD